jgi:hypothetical protein
MTMTVGVAGCPWREETMSVARVLLDLDFISLRSRIVRYVGLGE